MPRTWIEVASLTRAISAGWPRPKAAVTPATDATSSHDADTASTSATAARATDTAAIAVPTSSDRRAPTRSTRRRDWREQISATTADGISPSPMLSGLQPRAASVAGTASSSANQAAGRDAPASAACTTTRLRTTLRGRKPSGRRRTCRTSRGVATASSAAPISATVRPVDGDWTSSTRPVATAATRAAPVPSSWPPGPLAGAARTTRGTSRTASAGSISTARHPSHASSAPPASGPSELSAAATPAIRPRAVARIRPSYRLDSSAVASTGVAAAPAPWSSRAASSTGSESAAAAPKEPAAISSRPATSGARTPTRSAIRP
jgi:hypothetical protein